MNENKSNTDFQKIDYYQGEKKWCFAIVLNRACDNYQDNYKKNKTKLFSESLLKFEEVNRKDWFDEETRKLITQMDTEDPSLKSEAPPKFWGILNYSQVNRILNDVRNYFSHYYHNDFCLNFSDKDSMRIIMEKAYAKAKEKIIGKLKKETDLKFPELFETSGRITPAGIVFLASFFVERRILSRLLGYVEGFKDTRGEYGITREIFTVYCLKDSYSIAAPSREAVLFRDILGYLSRVPSEFFKYRKEHCEKEDHPERKTDKFITFAVKYLEGFGLKGLNDYTVAFGRMEIIRDEIKESENENEEYRPHPNQGKVNVLFESKTDGEETPYYINHNTVIALIQNKEGKIRNCKIGVNELKYLVLLCLRGKAQEAIQTIDSYISNLEEQFAKPLSSIEAGDLETLKSGLPEFILKQIGIETPDKAKEKTARLKYIREKWAKKKKESAETELHRKGRDIIRYINWHCKTGKKLTVEQYNFILGLLIDKNFANFNGLLTKLKLTEMVEEPIIRGLHGKKTLNELHIKVCDLVLEELAFIEKNTPDKLAEFIGIERMPDERAPSYENKVKAFIEQPMIYKGFLRENVFKENKKTFAKLAEETLGQNTDIPLGKEFYFVADIEKDEKKNRFHKDNAVLYETLALDRLCVMMARACFGKINNDLQKKGERLVWQKENGKEIIILEIQNPVRPGSNFSIRFSIADYTKLYVMDDTEFLCGLIKHFFPAEKTIDYHKLYSDGINHYTGRQMEGINAILKLEEKIIKNKNISMTGNYIGFKTILAQSGYPEPKQNTLRRVRNSLMHYNLRFEPTDYKNFVEIMKSEGLESKKNNNKTFKKWKQRSGF